MGAVAPPVSSRDALTFPPDKTSHLFPGEIVAAPSSVWFSNWTVMRIPWKACWAPARSLIGQAWGVTGEFALLTASQVMLMLMAGTPPLRTTA